MSQLGIEETFIAANADSILTEIKESIAELSLDERLELAAFIAHLNRVGDAGYQAELERRMTWMDAGDKVPATTPRFEKCISN